MQLLAALDPKLALIHTHAVEMSPPPLLSEYCIAKVWLSPLPPDGVTESAVTVDPSTVQVPSVCHPLLTLSLVAYMYTFFAPAYPPVNVIARLTVRCVPATSSELFAKFTLHWPLLRLPLVPNPPPVP